MLSICPRDSGAVRCRPVTSSHLSFGGAPQVGQRTEIIFLGRVPLSSEDTAPCRMDKNDPPAIALMLCKKLGCANSVKHLQTHRQSWGGSKCVADARVAGLEKDAADAKTDLAKQQEKTVSAERSLLELQQQIKKRVISTDQRKHIIEILTSGPKGSIKITCVRGDGEGLCFCDSD